MNKSYRQPIRVMATSVLLSTGLIFGPEIGLKDRFWEVKVEAAAETYYKTTANLNLRKSASKTASILTTIPKGKQVTYISKSGSWFKVKYGTKTGYVSSSYLKAVSQTSTSVYTTKAVFRKFKLAFVVYTDVLV